MESLCDLEHPCIYVGVTVHAILLLIGLVSLYYDFIILSYMTYANSEVVKLAKNVTPVTW